MGTVDVGPVPVSVFRFRARIFHIRSCLRGSLSDADADADSGSINLEGNLDGCLILEGAIADAAAPSNIAGSQTAA